MELNAPRLQSGDLALTCREPSFRASQEGTPRAYTPSAISTTTFTAPNVSIVTVGQWVVPEDGDSAHLARMVKSISGTTATLDAAWPSVTGVTRIRGWLGADVPWAVTTADAASLFDVISTRHAAQTNEPDSFWSGEGDMMIGLSGANAGRARTIAGFTATSGTATDSAGLATAVNDLFIVRTLVKSEATIEATVAQKTLERQSMGTGRNDADIPVPLTTESKVTMELAVKPIVTPGSSGVAASKPVSLNQFLEDCFTRTSDTGGTVVTADATTVDLTSSVITQGGFLLMNTGEVIQVLTTGGQDVSAYPTATLDHASVTVGSTAHAFTWYQRKATDFRTRTWDLWRGGMLRQCMQGCMPNVTLSMERDNIAKFKFDYAVGEAFEYNVARPVALGATAPLGVADSGVPNNMNGARCIIDGIRCNISELNIDFNFQPHVRPSLQGFNQSDGCFNDPQPVKVTFKILADDDDRSGMVAIPDRIRRAKYIQFMTQIGSAAGKTFAIAVPAMYLTANSFAHVDREGMYEVTATAVKPEFAYGTGYANLPDVSFGWG